MRTIYILFNFVYLYMMFIHAATDAKCERSTEHKKRKRHSASSANQAQKKKSRPEKRKWVPKRKSPYYHHSAMIQHYVA